MTTSRQERKNNDRIKLSLAPKNYDGNRNVKFENRNVKFDELKQILKAHNYSPIIWTDGIRKASNFKSAEGFVIDIDKDLSIEDAESKLKDLNLNYILIPSKSHTTDHNKYHILILFSRRVESRAEYEKIARYIGSEIFPECDPAVTDAARYMYGSPDHVRASLYFEGINFDVEGFEAENVKAVTPNRLTSKMTLSDLNRIRKHCPVIDDAFKSIEDNKGVEKTTGHNKRLTAASMIKHTIDDESYVLDLFKNVADFNEAKTLQQYRSINKAPVTCHQLQDWGLCNGFCQLMQDISKKSPIAFAYRKGVQLELTDTLLKNARDNDNLTELFKRIKMLSILEQKALTKRIQLETGLTKEDIKNQVSRIEVVDETKPYLINGEIDEVKAAKYIIEKYQIMRFHENFYRFKDSIWNLFPNEETESLIHHEIKKYSDNHTISEVINAVKREALVTPMQIQDAQDKFVIACNNGLFDVRTGSFKSIEPEDYRFKKMKAGYDPNAKCPAFLKLIDELFKGDTDSLEKKTMLQELSGYLLIPDYSLIKKMFYFYGPKANNGKSTFIDIIRSVIGPEYFTSVPMSRLDSFMLMGLYGKHANVVGDQDAHTRVPDGTVKQLVGGRDEITADRKYRDPIQFVNYARLIFAVNKLPYTGVKDAGYFTRADILVFNNQFLPNPDPFEPRKMKADQEKIQHIKEDELDGILNWALEGLHRLLQNGKLTRVPSSVNALDEYRIENNSVLLFVEDSCNLRPTAEYGQSDFYTNYKNWCIKHGFTNPLKSTTFYRTLESEFGITFRRTRNERLVMGIEPM